MKYPEIVGNISFDSKLDNLSFCLCDEFKVGQNFGWDRPIYIGEKIAIENIFRRRYKHKIIRNQTGTIRIRFVVNCKGESGMFRLMGMNENYEEFLFDKSITQQLLTITKGLNKWNIYTIGGSNYDYYNYLLFKIKDGQIIEILP